MLSPLTFSVVEVEFDGLALVYVQVGEPHGGGEQDQQQQELELLPDLLHGEAQHPGSLILRQPPGRCSEWVGKGGISAASRRCFLAAGRAASPGRRTGWSTTRS